jgi:succinate dehydrogenase / fumarate reductase flavoprotein subunit
MWNKVGMARSKGLTEAIEEIAALREEFYKDVKVPDANSFNQELDKAGRVADFRTRVNCLQKMPYIVMNLVGHFRESTNLKMVKHNEMMKILLTLLLGSTLVPSEAVLHKEPLVYENVKLVTRSYK